MEFADHKEISRESYDSHWVSNIGLTVHRITAKQLIDRQTFMQLFFFFFYGYGMAKYG